MQEGRWGGEKEERGNYNNVSGGGVDKEGEMKRRDKVEGV